MRTRYEGTVADAEHEEMAARLAEAGVFDDADDFFDALDAGADVLDDHVEPLELVERLKLQRPAVGPTAKIYAWLEAHPDGARWDGLLAWIQEVAIDHEWCTSSEWVKPGTNRRFCVSHLPTARTSVLFAVIDQPVFAVHILRIDDDLFDAAG